MAMKWRREYSDASVAWVTETPHGFAMLYLPPGASTNGTLRVARTPTAAMALADQMAGKVASESGWWVPERQT